ncbi:MAG TPA: ABC transporter ATP-binding protein [Chroococcales cyanobacterium]
MTESSVRSLTATALSAGFSERRVLENVTVDVAPGEIIAIAGPNGAGKSTLVKTLSRQLRPLAGSVNLGGKDIWSISAREFACSIAYVPQTLEPSSDLTVRELIMLGRNPHQKWWQWQGTESDIKAVQEAIEDTDLTRLTAKAISQLSGGERQRVAIATALAQQPEIMILDEPTSHLDYKHQLDLINLILRLKERNMGVVVVLHDLNVIMETADRVVLIETNSNAPSRVAEIGAPATVFQRSTLKRIFEVDIEFVVDPASGKTLLNPFSRTVCGADSSDSSAGS